MVNNMVFKISFFGKRGVGFYFIKLITWVLVLLLECWVVIHCIYAFGISDNSRVILLLGFQLGIQVCTITYYLESVERFQ